MKTRSTLTAILAFGIGLVAGSRTFLAPTAVSWAASLGWLRARETRLGFLARPRTPRLLTALGLLELIGDKLPFTPSRTRPPAFAARVLAGAMSGSVIGSTGGSLPAGLVAGALGAAAGTVGGRVARGRLAQVIGRDWPAALLEDGLAAAGALVILRIARTRL